MRLVSAEVYEDTRWDRPDHLVGVNPRVDGLKSRAPILGNVAILVELAIEQHEVGQGVVLALRVVPPDGTGGVVIQTEDQVIPAQFRWQKGYRFEHLRFEVPGPYEFRFEVDGATFATIPLDVQLLP